MKILVLNGYTNDPKYQPYIDALENTILSNKEHEIEYFRLKDMNIHYCTGCWSCWYKTPGLCSIKDDYEQVLSRIPNADLIFYVSPVIAGYESSILKTAKDRSIPVAHPYITIYEGEQHHYRRYKSMPDVCVLLSKDSTTYEEDINLIKHTYERMVLNFHSKLHRFKVVETTGGINDVFSRI